MSSKRAMQVFMIRCLERSARQRGDLDDANRFALRADALEQGFLFPELHGYTNTCGNCDGDGFNMLAHGPEICGKCRGNGTLPEESETG